MEKPARPLPGLHTLKHSSAARLLVVVGAVTAFTLAGILIPRLFRDDSASGPSMPVADAGWSRAYIYDGATGQGVSISPDGKVIESYNDMGRFTDSRVIARSRSIAFLSTESVDVGPVPADRSGSGVFSVAVPEKALVTVLGVPDRLVLAIHQQEGGNLTLVDVDARQTLNVGRLLGNPAPKYTLDQLKLEPSGTVFAVYDSATKRTGVISFARPEPRYYPNEALAISADRVLTRTRSGLKTTVTVFGLDGSTIATLDTDSLVGATMDDHVAYLVTSDDELLRLDEGATEPVSLAHVSDAAKIVVTDNGTRLVVDSPWGFTFLDSSGNELGQLSPGEGGVENPARASRCLAASVNRLTTPAGSPSTKSPVRDGPALLKLEDLTLTPVAQLPIQTSTPDGCTAAALIGETQNFQLVSVDAPATGEPPVVGPYKKMFVSPNPNQWIAMTPDNEIQLVHFDDGAAHVAATIPFPLVDYITVSFTPAATNSP